ncbi:MAG: hypothetical protein NZ554_03675 [Bryobacteraceae bacterium]|nr:hypothetical protein [Bryobacteraceae bacterium]
MLEPVGFATPQASGCPEQRRLVQAVADFESLLVAQLLKAARGAGGWMGTGEDQTAASMLEIAEEHLAAVIAASGGLGLKNLLLEGLGATAEGEACRLQTKSVSVNKDP